MKNRLAKYVLLLSSLLVSTYGYCQTDKQPDCRNEQCLEVVHFDSVRLNQTIPIRLTADSLVQLLGNPDSIITETEWECGNYIDDEMSVEIYYYGHTRFLVSNGVALLHVLNLEDGRFTFDFESTQIKKGMDLAALKTIFPNAVSALKEGWEGYNRDGRMKVLMRENPDYGESSGWIFSFKGTRIEAITLWWFIC